MKIKSLKVFCYEKVINRLGQCPKPVVFRKNDIPKPIDNNRKLDKFM